MDDYNGCYEELSGELEFPLFRQYVVQEETTDRVYWGVHDYGDNKDDNEESIIRD